MKDPDVNKYLEARFESWPIKKLKEYVRRVKSDPNCIFMAIVLKEDNMHIGNLKLVIDRNHKYADVSIFIGEKAYWGKNIAPEALSSVVRYSFKKLKLHKLIAETYEVNKGSINAFKKAGFIIEGRRKRQYLYNGNYIDSILLGIVRK